MKKRLITLMAAAVLTTAAFGNTAPAGAQSCGAASATQPTSSQSPAERAAVTCLINEVRASHRLHRLTVVPTLTTIAARYSQRLVAQGFFAHVDAVTHSTIETRGRAYTSGSRIWALGENLAWATGFRSTPNEILAMWMASPGHRANLLDPEWRNIGVGISAGTPVGAAGATYAAEFGSKILNRKPRHKARRRA